MRARSNEPRARRNNKRLLSASALLLVGSVAGCAQPIAPSPFADASIEQLISDPTNWTGRPVEVEGVVVARADDRWRLKENCASNARSVSVRWDNVPGFHASDDGAKVRVRAIFRNDAVVRGGNGEVINASAQNRGTLENVSILWRSPANLPRCRY